MLAGELVFACCMRIYPFNLVVREEFQGWSNYSLYALMVLVSLFFDTARSAARDLPILRLRALENLRRSGRQTFTVLVGVISFLVISKDNNISRPFLLFFLGSLFVVLFGTNWVFPELIARTFFSGSRGQRTLILGDSVKAENMWEWLEERKAFGFEVVGVLDPQDRLRLEARLAEYRAQQLIILGIPKSLPRVQEYCRICEKLGVRLLLLNDSETSIGRSMEIDQQDGMQFISFQSDRLECPLNRFVKRLFDLTIAIPVCLLILPPLALIVHLLHRAQATGPLFFRQKRTGVHGGEFMIFKFRSMIVDNDDETRQAAEGDIRIFPAGKWLRRTSLDEIPQFLNVILGNMSIVGPRPHLSAHDDLFAQAANAYRLRQFTKPGITGLAQVSGWRGETRTSLDVQMRTEADIHYLEHWTLFLDLLIVIKTGRQMLFPPATAY